MNSLLNMDILWAVYNDSRTVFTLADVAMLTGNTQFTSINQKLNYQVRRKKLLNPRKGIYAKPNYNPEELACILYTPSYLSLDYVLQKAGVIFQYDSRISAISYLSRSVEIANNVISYRKIKNEILVNTSGIRLEGNINTATAERAFLDTLYLNGAYYFDHLNPLNKEAIYKLLSVYNSKKLTERVNTIFENGKY